MEANAQGNAGGGDEFVLSLTERERSHVSDALTLELRETMKFLKRELKYDPVSRDAHDMFEQLHFTTRLLDRVGWPDESRPRSSSSD
jgi:hypothetical protein